MLRSTGGNRQAPDAIQEVSAKRQLDVVENKLRKTKAQTEHKHKNGGSSSQAKNKGLKRNPHKGKNGSYPSQSKLVPSSNECQDTTPLR